MVVRPDIPGVAEHWGRSVFHCPCCHGWESRDRPLAILDNDVSAQHRALLLALWTDDVTLLTNGPSALDDEQLERVRAAGVVIDHRPVAALHGNGESLRAVEFADGSELLCAGALVAVTPHQRSTLAEQLGATAAAPGQLAADALVIDAMHATTARGVRRRRPQHADALGGEREIDRLQRRRHDRLQPDQRRPSNLSEDSALSIGGRLTFGTLIGGEPRVMLTSGLHRSVVSPGTVAGGVGTSAVDVLQHGRYREGGGDQPFAHRESSPSTSWFQDAPAPAKVGQRVAEHFGCSIVAVQR